MRHNVGHSIETAFWPERRRVSWSATGLIPEGGALSAPQEVVDLVERFERNRSQYMSASYNETQLRREFLDPLFEALGWDVNNRRGFTEAYKDVVHEDSIRVSDQARAPDYAFRHGGHRVFFLEAKKPAVNIKMDVGPSYQLRRYGWSANLTLSVLSDFEEFAVYDTQVRPRPTDKASVARVAFWTYRDYIDHWDEIASIFSHDAVPMGSFDRYAKDSTRKKGTAQVDAAFLQEIESWRAELARVIALRNPSLRTKELNFAVQRTIDRIVFLRICEARRIEDEGRLRDVASGSGTYGRLLDLFQVADDRYNSGIFHFRRERSRSDESLDVITPSLTIDDGVLKSILRGLYYPECPYEFSVLPADILGRVYEQFLGKVIRLTSGHHAKVEDKPEVRKAGGVYYTPSYVVERIVNSTLGELLKSLTPKTASKLRVLDPACGSGSFLIVAYQHLLDWHLERYENDGPEKHVKQLVKGPRGEWRLTTSERKRILLNNIYGVDIDSQAVEVTKLSLALKVLEGETSETLGQTIKLLADRALPDLDANIKCGNSLVGPDFYERQEQLFLVEEELERINVFDWNTAFPQVMAAGGFDAVVGNPPYIRVHRLDGALKQYLWKEYESFAEKGDIYACFIERGLSLLRDGGFISFITPNTWSSLQSFRHLRKLVLEESDIVQLVRTPSRVFKNATVRTLIFVLRRRLGGKPSEEHVVLEMDSDGLVKNAGTVARSSIERAHQLNLLLFAEQDSDEPAYVSTVGQESEFAYGFKTGDDSLFLSERSEGGTWRPYCRSADVHPLQPLKPSGWVDYRPAAMREHRKTARPGEPERFTRPKVVVARMGRQLVATFDSEGTLVKDAMLLLRNDDGVVELKLLAGILSSNFVNDLYAAQFITIDVLKNALLSLPLPGPLTSLLSTPEALELVGLVDQMIGSAADGVARDARQTRLDYLVRRLYSISADSQESETDGAK
jgi:hypothetical protein